MRYPLLAFLFVLVVPIFTALALLTGKAEIRGPQADFSVVTSAATGGIRVHNWTLVRP